jgi:hypothetical protein
MNMVDDATGTTLCRMEEEYCEEHNARFAVAAVAEQDYHLPSPGAREWEKIFRLERERVLSNDGVVRDENRFYPVEWQSQHHAPAKSKVRVCEWEDRRMEIHYRGQKLRWKEIDRFDYDKNSREKNNERQSTRKTKHKKGTLP